MIFNTPIAVATRKYMQLNRERKHGNILVSNFIWGFVRAWQIDATVEGFLCLRKLERNWSTILFGFRSPFTILDICTTLCTFVTIFVLKLKKKNEYSYAVSWNTHLAYIYNRTAKQEMFYLENRRKNYANKWSTLYDTFCKNNTLVHLIFFSYFIIYVPQICKTKPSYIKSRRRGYLYSRGTLHAKNDQFQQLVYLA